MKIYLIKLTLVLSLLITPFILEAQTYPIQVQAMSPQPTPVSVPQLLGQSGQPMLILINTSNKAQSLKLSVSLTSSNKIAAYLDVLKKKPTRPIIVPAFGSITLSGDDLSDVYRNYTTHDIDYKGIEPHELAQNPLFPEGTYQICFTVYEYNTNVQLSSDEPLGCTLPFIVTTPEPPIITYPLDHAEIELAPYDNLNFNWTPVTSPGAFINYKIKIVEVPPQVNPYDAMANQKFTLWEEDGIFSSFFLYDISKPSFEINKNYAVQITAYDPSGNAYFKNEGKSAIHQFTIDEPIIFPPALIVPQVGDNYDESAKEINFAWTPINKIGTSVSYKVQVAELGKYTTQDVFNHSANIIFDHTTAANDHYNWNISKLNLDKSIQYAVRVQVYGDYEILNVNNGGWSEAVSFGFEEKPISPAEFINPLDGDVLTVTAPVEIDFEWEAPNNIDLKNIRYELSFFDTKDKKEPILNISDLSTNSYTFEDNGMNTFKSTYQAVLRTYDTNGENIFDNDGMSIPVNFTLEQIPLYSRPVIISPQDNSINKSYLPLSVSLQWDHDVSKYSGTKYRVSLWEDDPLLSREDVAASRPPLYEIDDFSALKIENFPENIDLDEDQKYLVMVEAYHPDGSAEYENEGKSEIVRFEMERELYTQNLDVDCGASCSTELSSSTIPYGLYSNGDELVFGGFIIKLGSNVQYNSATQTYNGIGEIKSSDFFKSPIQVNITGVKANNNGEIFAGEINALTNNQVQMPSSWTDLSVNSTHPNNSLQVVESLENHAISNDFTSSNAVKLPVVFDGVYMTQLRLSVASSLVGYGTNYGNGDNNSFVETEAKLVSYKEIADDEYWFFGNKACISSAGPSMAVEGSPNPLYIMGQKNVNEPSYTLELSEVSRQEYDCNGLLPEVFISGYVNYTHEELGTIKNHSVTNLSTQPLKGKFETSFQNWEDWTASFYLVDQHNLLSPVSLTHDDMDGFEFEFTHGVIDHSIQRNPLGFLPVEWESHSITRRGSIYTFPWQGIFIKDMEMTLPHFIDLYDSPGIVNARAKKQLHNFYLDGTGLNGKVLTSDMEPELSALAIGEWKYRLQELDMKIYENNLETMSLDGNVYVPIFEEFLDIQLELGSIYLLTSNGFVPTYNWFASSDLSGVTVNVPAWNATTELNEDSQIKLTVGADKMNALLRFDFGGTFDFENQIGFVRNNNLQGLEFRDLSVYNNRFFNGNLNHLIGAEEAVFGVRASDFDKIGGYGVNIQQVTIEDLGSANQLNSLKFDYDFGLDDLIGGLSVDGSMEVISKPVGNKRVSSFTQTVTKIADIEFENTTIPSGKISGRLQWKDTENSQHFEGDLWGKILDYNGAFHGYFGNVEGYGYWSLAIKKNFGAPIPIVPGAMFATELSGGMYCNMEKVVPVRGASATDVSFNPPQSPHEIDNFGITIGTLLFLDDGSSFNGRFLLGVELDTDENALDHINLSGIGHLFDDEVTMAYWFKNSELSESAQLKIDGEIEYSYAQGRLWGAFGYDMNFQDGIITGSGTDVINFDFGGPKWHIHAGTAQNPMNMNVNILEDPVACTGFIKVGGDFGGNIGKALGGMEFGLNGSFTSVSNGVWFPLSIDDKVRAGCDIQIDVRGGVGYGLDYCANHNPSDFFFYAGFDVTASGYLEYWEDPDSWFYYFEKQGEWNDWINCTLGVGGNIFLNSPTGLDGHFTFSGTFLGEPYSINPSFQVGDRCH